MGLHADVPLRVDSNGIANYNTGTDVKSTILKIYWASHDLQSVTAVCQNALLQKTHLKKYRSWNVWYKTFNVEI